MVSKSIQNFKNLQNFTSIQDALSSLFGENIGIEKSRRISGGDINDAYGLTLTDGTVIFMKTNKKENASFFTAEATGLAAIAQTSTINTPHLLCTGTDSGKSEYSFLLMEFIEGTRQIKNYWEIFAHELAAMHHAATADFVTNGKYGFFQDNYIGASRQINTARESWIDFFRDCRLKPQFEHAAQYFDPTDKKRIRQLLDNLDKFLVEPEQPALLHGDLWSGNFITGNDGKAWLIDPAVSVGHAEADLAMTELFGGFPQIFYDAYRDAAPLQPGYEDRRDLYNLYHLLNHLNLFGRSYLAPVKRILAKYVS